MTAGEIIVDNNMNNTQLKNQKFEVIETIMKFTIYVYNLSS